MKRTTVGTAKVRTIAHSVVVVCIGLCFATVGSALADNVAYIRGDQVPKLSITPQSPTATDVVTFTTPLDGTVHGNDCEMRANLLGSPLITRDDANRLITLSTDGIYTDFCTRIFIPHAGAEGEFGPLDAGSWLFRDGYGNEVSFEVAAELALGDFDGNGVFTTADINALVSAIATDSSDAAFDLNGDGAISVEDRDSWLGIAGAELNSNGNPFFTGDLNLDGTVDSTDLGQLLNNFNTSDEVAWDGGELNGDGAVDSSDLGLLLNDFGNVSAATSAVPEPSGVAVVLSALLSTLVFCRRT